MRLGHIYNYNDMCKCWFLWLWRPASYGGCLQGSSPWISLVRLSYWRDVLVTACVTSSASRFAPMTSQSPASPAYHPRLNLRTFGFWTVRPNQKTPLQCRRLWMLWPTSTSGWRSRLGVLFLSYFGSRLVWSWIWGFVPLQNFADGVHTHMCIVMYTY